MAVISAREVLPRTAQHRFGESPSAQTKWVATVDGPTASQDVINYIGVFHGSMHPEWNWLYCLDISLSESDRHHVEITYTYEVPKQDDLQPNPLARSDVWSFSTGGAQVPAFFAYLSGNTPKPLLDFNGQFIEGLTRPEAELRATISGNRAAFPLETAATVTNCVNSSPYLGAPPHTWMCAGISAQQAVEVVNGIEVRYWQIGVELIFRESGWAYYLPPVSWSFKENGKLIRAWVFDERGEERVPSATPQPVNPDGTRRTSPINFSDLVKARVHKEIDFQPYFGTPPF